MKLLEGKVAIVTGAARGIGKAIALKFAAEGANIAFTDLVIDENGLATQKEIEALGVKAKGYASNAANFEETHNVVAEIVKDFGRVDILVNNAGITKDGLMMRMRCRHRCQPEIGFQLYPRLYSGDDETAFGQYHQYGFCGWCTW